MTRLILPVILAGAIDPTPDIQKLIAMAQVQMIEAALGEHLCKLGGPEHQHSMEARRNIAAGAIHVEPRVCHIVKDGKRLLYRYRVVANAISTLEFVHDGKQHVTLAWDKEMR
jgi:hypothetical protein